MTQSGDVLIVEEDDEPKTFKKGQIESESEADTDGSLSTDSDEPDLPAVEDHGDDHNLAALKPLKDIAITGVEIDDDDDDVIKKVNISYSNYMLNSLFSETWTEKEKINEKREE